MRRRSASSASSRMLDTAAQEGAPRCSGRATRATRTARASRGAGCRPSTPGRSRRPCAGRAGSCGPAGASSPSSTRLLELGRVAARGRASRAAPRRPRRAPTSPALRSRPNSFTSTDGRSSNRNRTTEPRGFVDFGGSSTSTRPPCDRCTRTRGPPNAKTRYLPRRPTPSSVRPTSSAARGRHGLERGELQQVGGREREPPTASVEPLGQRLDLGELGHSGPEAESPEIAVNAPSRRRRRGARSARTPRCDRDASGATGCTRGS